MPSEIEQLDASLPLASTDAADAQGQRKVRLLRTIATVGVLALFFILIPLLSSTGVVQDHNLNRLGRYLCLAIVALGIDLIWGYAGVLSLGQALFFCVGAYATAMFLALPAGGGDVRPEYHNIPQFFFFNNVHSLDGAPFWKPFDSPIFALGMAILLPAALATVFGFFIFRSRVRGVYFSIVTQAVAWGAWLLISRNEMLLGGTNGLTNFYKPLTTEHRWILGLYLATLVMLVLCYLLCLAIVRSRLGRILVAVRDKESRLYFAGYRPYAFKVFAFAVAAVLAAIGGMLYVPQMGIITPAKLKVEESIMMVIWVAVGGRGRLWGAVFGALLVNYTYSVLTSDLPNAWPFVQGGMFLAVVLLFPDGFVGLWDKLERTIAEGQGAVRAGLAAAPLGLIGLFILLEALGLMPGLLDSAKSGAIKSKYLVLLSALTAVAVAGFLLRKSAARPRVLSDAALQPAGGRLS